MDKYGYIEIFLVLAGIWLLCGVAVVAYITSSVTSIMTLNKLKNEINGAQVETASLSE